MAFRPKRIEPRPRAMPKPIPEQHRRDDVVMATPALIQAPRAGTRVQRSAAQKPQTMRSASWLAAVRTIERCVLCGAPGTEPAHRNEGKGAGIKAHDCWTAALCRTCHRAIDQGGALTREQRRTEIDRAIVLTLAELVRAGKVGVL